MSKGKTVEVFLNGDSKNVPSWVHDEEDFRRVLGVPPGMGVAYENRRDEVIDHYGGHIFVAGDRYVTTGLHIENKPEETQAEPDGLEPWQTDPDAWKTSE